MMLQCKYCSASFEEYDEEDLWGHIQMSHEEIFEEVQDWETPYMIEECYFV